MTLRVAQPKKGIVHVQADSQFELTSTFVRLQEFYESPYENIRRTTGWDLNMLAAEYVSHGEVFDYFSKWNGMNVPGHVVQDFFGHFDDLSAPEAKLNALLWRAQRRGLDPHHFYLIGTWKDEDITHEIAHAMYYLEPLYRSRMNDFVCMLKADSYREVYVPLQEWLRKRGYAEAVMDDEMQAYLATSEAAYLQEKLGVLDGCKAFDAGEVFRQIFKVHTGMEPIHV